MNTMNRCLHSAPVRLLMLLLLGTVWTSLFSNAAQAQTTVRQFPPAALRGMLTVTAPPEVLINNAAMRLSPGARIKGVNNGLVMSASLVGQSVLVNYVRNPQGQIQEVWILNAQEALEKRAGMETMTNFSFSSDADKPKTDDGQTPYNQLPSYNGK
jgi:hypothetical protein